MVARRKVRQAGSQSGPLRPASWLHLFPHRAIALGSCAHMLWTCCWSVQVTPLHWHSGRPALQPLPGPPPLPAPAARNACQLSIAAARASPAWTACGAHQSDLWACRPAEMTNDPIQAGTCRGKQRVRPHVSPQHQRTVGGLRHPLLGRDLSREDPHHVAQQQCCQAQQPDMAHLQACKRGRRAAAVGLVDVGGSGRGGHLLPERRIGRELTCDDLPAVVLLRRQSCPQSPPPSSASAPG